MSGIIISVHRQRRFSDDGGNGNDENHFSRPPFSRRDPCDDTPEDWSLAARKEGEEEESISLKCRLWREEWRRRVEELRGLRRELCWQADWHAGEWRLVDTITWQEVHPDAEAEREANWSSG